MITNSIFLFLRLWSNTFVFHFLILLWNKIQNILTFTIFFCHQNLLRKLLLFIFHRLRQFLLLSENFWFSRFSKQDALIFQSLQCLMLLFSKVFDFIIFHAKEKSHVFNFALFDNLVFFLFKTFFFFLKLRTNSLIIFIISEFLIFNQFFIFHDDFSLSFVLLLSTSFQWILRVKFRNLFFVIFVI
jgi:hypothetical protein